MTKVLGLALATVLVLAPAVAGAQSPSPYDTRYVPRNAPASGLPLLAAMADGAATRAVVPPGASGIVLRWCRPEIPFGAWQFGSPAMKRKLLDERWCEVSWQGKVGNVRGSSLDVQP